MTLHFIEWNNRQTFVFRAFDVGSIQRERDNVMRRVMRQIEVREFSPLTDAKNDNLAHRSRHSTRDGALLPDVKERKTIALEPGIMSKDVDFVIENRLQTLEMWAQTGRAAGLDASQISRQAALYAAAVLVPVCGHAVQKLGTTGFEPDGFMLQSGAFQFAARRNLKQVTVTGWLPEGHAQPVTVTLACGEHRLSKSCATGAMFSIDMPLSIAADTQHEFRIALSSSYQPAAVSSESQDNRNLGCIIQSVEFT